MKECMLEYEHHRHGQVCGRSTQLQTVVLLLNLVCGLQCKGKPTSSWKSNIAMSVAGVVKHPTLILSLSLVCGLQCKGAPMSP